MNHAPTLVAGVKRSAAILLLLTVATGATGQDIQRGLKNYQDISGGRKKLEQLSQQERDEVLLVHRYMQAQRANQSGTPACREARSRATNAASELADYSRRLRSCAETADFADDCSSEFSRVKNAHSDYESAVSDVGSNCR